jgi:polysaccharide biosynthesis transport protein
MHLSEVWRVLRARKQRFLLISGGCVLLAVSITLILPETYVATVSVVIDSKATDPVTGAAAPGELMPSNLITQLDIIASTRVALKVVDRFHLDSNPQMIESFAAATGGAGTIRDWLAARLLNKLTAEPTHQSSVVNISFAAPDPQFAAGVANAFADAYMQTDFELNMDPASRQASWFDQQLQQLKRNLQLAQERLSQYQQKKSIVASDDRLDVENAKLAELSSQYVLAQSAVSDTDTRRRQMNQALKKGEIQQLPDILGNSLLQSMKADLTRAQGRLAQLAQRYDRNHPEYQSAAAEVQTLEARFSAELQTATGSINQAAEMAVQRASELQHQVDRQKQQILELRQTRDNVSVLQRDMEIAQHAYDAVSNRASEVRLQSQLNQSTVAILSPAAIPAKPARPIVALNVALGLFFGIALATSLCSFAEIRDPRLRLTRGVTELAGLPILAEIPQRASKRQVRRRKAKIMLSPAVLGEA